MFLDQQARIHGPTDAASAASTKACVEGPVDGTSISRRHSGGSIAPAVVLRLNRRIGPSPVRRCLRLSQNDAACNPDSRRRGSSTVQAARYCILHGPCAGADDGEHCTGAQPLNGVLSSSSATSSRAGVVSRNSRIADEPGAETVGVDCNAQRGTRVRCTRLRQSRQRVAQLHLEQPTCST